VTAWREPPIEAREAFVACVHDLRTLASQHRRSRPSQRVRKKAASTTQSDNLIQARRFRS